MRMHFIKGAMMFNVTGDQLKGISNICCKKSEDRWTILLKAKSSDDIKGKRQSEKPDNQRAMTRRGKQSHY